MLPIRQLLDKIKWDTQFGAAEFKLGYYDRCSKTLIILFLTQIARKKGDAFAFYVIREGEVITIPYHRIKRVWRNDELIWERKFPV